MADVESTSEKCEQFLEALNAVAWCKQGETVLVAVHKFTPEVLEIMRDHETKVFPGNLTVKLNRSTLAHFQQKYEEGLPVPALLVWRPESVEIWFRTHKSEEFPYDTWSDPKAAAYERECVTLTASELGSKCPQYHKQHVASSKACPSTIPTL